MFASRENIIKHYEAMVQADLGSDARLKVLTAYHLTEKALNNSSFDVTDIEATAIISFLESTGFDGEDCSLLTTLDMSCVQMSKHGVSELIDFLAEDTSRYYYYATGGK